MMTEGHPRPGMTTTGRRLTATGRRLRTPMRMGRPRRVAVDHPHAILTTMTTTVGPHLLATGAHRRPMMTMMRHPRPVRGGSKSIQHQA